MEAFQVFKIQLKIDYFGQQINIKKSLEKSLNMQFSRISSHYAVCLTWLKWQGIVGYPAWYQFVGNKGTAAAWNFRGSCPLFGSTL